MVMVLKGMATGTNGMVMATVTDDEMTTVRTEEGTEVGVMEVTGDMAQMGDRVNHDNHHHSHAKESLRLMTEEDRMGMVVIGRGVKRDLERGVIRGREREVDQGRMGGEEVMDQARRSWMIFSVLSKEIGTL
jgi:hypothetical protein